MALTALFLRLATVQALRGATLAGERVSDSSIGAIDQRAKDQRRPTLAVYAEDLTAGQLEGRDLLTGDRSLQITIEAVVADQLETEGGAEITITIPETDEGLELQLNLIERQILRRLQADVGPWSEIWRALIVRFQKFESRRGAGQGDGVRFAARQLALTVEPLPEPGFGEEPQGVWRKFLDLLEAEPSLAPLAPMLEAEFLGEALPDWRVAQAYLGLSAEGVAGMGVAPPFAAEPTEAAPLLGRVTIESGGDQLVIDPEPEG